MRKLISISVMALLLSVMATTTMAGNVEDCEILKDGDYSKGLYGLCIAWHNAGNDNARDRILANYDKKATGPNDPPMPGTVDEVPCPCWDDSVISAAMADGILEDCQAVPDEVFGAQFAIYDSQTYVGTYQFQVEDALCFTLDPNSAGNFVPFGPETSPEAVGRCRDDVELMCGL